MNEVYRQWKRILANPWILISEAVLGLLLTFGGLSFLLNTLALLGKALDARQIHSLAALSEHLSKFAQTIQSDGVSLLNPDFSGVHRTLYLVGLLIYGLLMGRHLYQHRIAFQDINKGTEGTSRWTTEAELNAQYPLVSLDKDTEYSGRAGVPVAFHPDRDKVWIDQTNTNVEVDGATQTGKTQTLTYPVIDLNIRAEFPDSMIINDIKGDILRRTYFHPMAREKFHFRVFNLIEPKNSMRYNPLFEIQQATFRHDTAKAQRKTQSLSYIFYNNPEAKEPVWDEGAMAIFEAIVLWIAELALSYRQAHWVNMTALIDVIDYLATEKNDKTGKTRLDDYFMTLPTSSPVRRAYSIALKAEKRQTASFYMMVAAKLKYFFTEDIKTLTSGQDFDFLDLAYPKDGKPTLLFVVFPYSDFSNAKLLKIFFTQLYQKLAEETTLGEGEFAVRLRSWFEEAQNTPDIEGMERYTNVGLASGMMYGFVVQSHAGFEQVYGKETSANILGAAGNTYYIKTDILAEAKEFSEQLGNTTVIAPQRSGSPLDSDKSFTELEKGRPLMDPIELTRLMQSEWVLNRTKFTKDLKGKPIRPYPIKAFYKADKDGQGHITSYHNHMNARFAYDYLFGEAGGYFDTRGKKLSELELRGEAIPTEERQPLQEVSDAELIIPHDLLDLILERGLVADALKKFAGPPEEKEELLVQLTDLDEQLQDYKEKINAALSDDETILPKRELEKSRQANSPSRPDSVAHDNGARHDRNRRWESSDAPDVSLGSSRDDGDTHSRAAVALHTPSPLESLNNKRAAARKEREDKILTEMLESLRNLEEDSSANISDLFGASYPRFLDLVSTYFGENHRRFVEDPTLTVKQFRTWLDGAKKSVQGRKFLAAYEKLREEGEFYER